MPVLDVIGYVLDGMQILLSTSILSLLTYMVCGGWEYIFRMVSFFFDKQLVKLIGVVFSYFDQLIKLDMFNQDLFSELTRNVYVFIGVIMFFRLMMLLIKYLINPDMVGDNKAGVNALIQRVIIGCCGILFLPTAFDLANDLQAAVLNDGIIQQLIVPSDMIDAMEEKMSKGGNYIGTYVLAGFISPNSNASSSDISAYNLGVQQGDLSNVNINDGGFLTGVFKYDYFFFISTLTLGYVFYYMLKYCIDIAGRVFKLLLYRLISPIAMIEYMINGSDDGVFKQWLTATISTYCMLFVRVLAIWFVMLVVTLMDSSSGYAGSLLANDDYFLRAIIIIALLGFMMDLPKLVGQIFGLDLEQEGSASGVLKQVGGMVKSAALGGLAVGGAAAGGLAGGVGKMVDARKQGVAKAKAESGDWKDANGNKLDKQAFNDRMKAEKKANTIGNLKKIDTLGQMKAFGGSVLSAAAGSNQFTGAVAKGYSDSKRSQEQVQETALSSAISKHKQEVAEEEAAKDRKTTAESAEATRQAVEAALNVKDRDSEGKPVNAEIKVAIPDLNVDVNSGTISQVNTSSRDYGGTDYRDRATASSPSVASVVANTIQSYDVTSNGHVENKTEQTIRQEAAQIASNATTEVFNGNVAQCTTDVRTELVNNNQMQAINDLTSSSTITAISQAGADRLGVDQSEFSSAISSAISSMSASTPGFNPSNATAEDTTKIINTAVQTFHTQAKDMIEHSPEFTHEVDAKVAEIQRHP